MDLGIEGKIAVVAASSKGLGFAIARELVLEGARVLVSGRDEARAAEARDSLRAEIDNSKDRVQSVAVDLSTSDGPARLVREALHLWGGVDILVANNGGPPPGPAFGLGDEAWEAGFRQTFQSSQKLAEEALPSMREKGWGRILFITSISVKQPVEGLAISTAMRSAVVGYAKMLSDEISGEGVTFNCLAPGTILTDRVRSIFSHRAEEQNMSVEEVSEAARTSIPVGRIGRPDEFAAAAAFLVSERASFITGTVLSVDGGMSRSLT